MENHLSLHGKVMKYFVRPKVYEPCTGTPSSPLLEHQVCVVYQYSTCFWRFSTIPVSCSWKSVLVVCTGQVASDT